MAAHIYFSESGNSGMFKSASAAYVYVCIYYALVFMGNGAFSSYIGLYYSKINLDTFTIGLLTSVGLITALCVQPLWGLAADRAKSKNSVLLLSLLLTSASIWLMPASGEHFWLLLASTALFYVFQCVVNPLSDTITLELAGKSQFNFSRVRTYGSVGFAGMSAIAGWILDRDINYMFPLFSAMMLLAFVCACTIPRVEGHQRKQKVRLKELFNSRALTVIYIYTFIIESTIGFFFTYHAVYCQEQGISTSLLGIGVMIGSISQFPFMIFFDRLYARFGVYKILLFSGLIHLLRWLLYAVTVTEFTVILSWALHGGTFILFYLCLAEYVNRHVRKELKASGQMMNSIMTLGISRIFGGLAGGAYASVFGIGSGFAVCAGLCAVAMLAFSWYVKRYAASTAAQAETNSVAQ
ncbi:MFS transporter [Paenibacillus xerothermodurans]|uniref:MFS transporter n=1 Tax=Paenibacillus xerothermodurans TaxID=1977292 RepID=UPI001057D66E|nr:MFS transporter [Paenibacillus xerothermodurans]